MLGFLRGARRPSPGEALAFERFVLEVRCVAGALTQTSRFGMSQSPLELGDDAQLAAALASLTAAAKAHLHRGDDLLTLVERAMPIGDAGFASGCRPDTGLSLLRAIAMAELLQTEAARYSGLPDLRCAADEAMSRLAGAYLQRLGGVLPNDVARAFPRFAHAVRARQPRSRRASTPAAAPSALGAIAAAVRR
jgi:hypothetical protein